MSTESPEMVKKPALRVAVSDLSTSPPPLPPRIPLLFPALLSAGLLWLSYFPVNAAWLAWFALVPLLALVRSRTRGLWIYPLAYLVGLAFYIGALQWLRHADDREMATIAGFVIKGGYLTWWSLAVYSAVYFPLAVFVLRRLDRRTRLPLSLTLPLVWTSLELVRAHFGTGFPWYFLGHTQHGLLPLIQIADITGAYGVTFLVAAVNGMVFELLCVREDFRACFRLPERRASLSPRGQLWLVGGLVIAALTYGFARLSQESFRSGPRVALIQGNFPQSLRNLASSTDEQKDVAAESSAEHFRDLADRAAAGRPSLIVWPETSAAFPWDVRADGSTDPYTQGAALFSLNRWPTRLLIGTNSYNQQTNTPSIPYNSAILLKPSGEPFVARYDKVHRVPFGEYVPLRDTFAIMNKLAPYDYDYSIRSGAELTRFPLGDYHFGVLICFEDSDPLLARQYVSCCSTPLDVLNNVLSGGMYGHLPHAADAPTADFLLNLSNDAWFDGSSEHDEHLAICRFRAVECRRSVARAVNMGISAVIDGSGRVVALPGDTWADSKKMSGVIFAAIPLDDRHSLYAYLGDWLPALCLLLLLIALFRPVRKREGSKPAGA